MRLSSEQRRPHQKMRIPTKTARKKTGAVEELNTPTVDVYGEKRGAAQDGALE